MLYKPLLERSVCENPPRIHYNDLLLLTPSDAYFDDHLIPYKIIIFEFYFGFCFSYVFDKFPHLLCLS